MGIVKLESVKLESVELEGVKLESVELDDVKLGIVKLEIEKLENVKLEMVKLEIIKLEIIKIRNYKNKGVYDVIILSSFKTHRMTLCHQTPKGPHFDGPSQKVSLGCAGTPGVPPAPFLGCVIEEEPRPVW